MGPAFRRTFSQRLWNLSLPPRMWVKEWGWGSAFPVGSWRTTEASWNFSTMRAILVLPSASRYLFSRRFMQLSEASILLVDDEPLLLALMREWLQQITAVVFCASDGVQALQVMDAQRIDLIIT